MRNLKSEEQQYLLHQLEEWSGNHLQRSSYLPMEESNPQELMNDELMTIGAHTETHPFVLGLRMLNQGFIRPLQEIILAV